MCRYSKRPMFGIGTKMSEKMKQANPREIAELVRCTMFSMEWEGRQRDTLVYWRGEFYRWEEGCYRIVELDEMKAAIIVAIGGTGQVATTGLVENVRLNLMSQVLLKGARKPDTWLTDKEDFERQVCAVAMKNGILEIGKDGGVELMGLTPDFFNLGKLPYEYDPEAKCERWQKFLGEITILDGKQERLLQEWAGYVLTPGQKYQVLLIMLGDAATGKGTYARTLRAMVGEKNCSSVPVRRFTDQFALYPTYGKMLNVVGDADAELNPKTEEVIKEWSGGDPLEYQKKYAMSFSDVATAKLLILTNELPTFTDKSDGTWRRLLIVKTDRIDREYRDPHLEEELKKELPGILNWALEGLRRLESRKRFEVSGLSQQVWQEHKNSANPAKAFLEEFYEFRPGEVLGVKTTHLYRAYRSWAKACGYAPMSDRTFGKQVFRAFPQMVKRRVGGRQSRFHVYSGVYMLPGTDLAGYLKR